MTPIEHFLIDIIQILFRDWIENTIADIGRFKSATDIFLPTLRNPFYKRWPLLFFNGRGFYFVRCCHKNLNVCRLGFFVRSQPKLWFRRHRHVFICLARKTLANLGKNTCRILRYWTEKMLADVGQERWPIEVLKRNITGLRGSNIF